MNIQKEKDEETFGVDTMDGICTTLQSLSSNLKGLLEDLTTVPDCYNLSPDLERLEYELHSLKDNIEVINRNLTSDRQAMSSCLAELEAFKSRYKNLQQEWDNQQEHMGRLQGEMYKARSQLKEQSSFCASLGAIMGNLMWKASRLPEVIDVLISGNKVGEFFCIVNGSLLSYVETYSIAMPDTSTNETQFILSLIGIITNIAASPAGREFLTTDPNGKELIQQMLNVMTLIPEPSGDCLIRVLLMAFYNISINKVGLIMLQDQTALLNKVSQYIMNNHNPELKLMSLRLLQSMTMNILSVQVYRNLMAMHAVIRELDFSGNQLTQQPVSMPLEKIKDLMNTSDADIRLASCSIVENFDVAKEKFSLKDEPSIHVPHNTCYVLKDQECCSTESTGAQFNPFQPRPYNVMS